MVVCFGQRRGAGSCWIESVDLRLVGRSGHGNVRCGQGKKERLVFPSHVSHLGGGRRVCERQD
jgi:hypothetical protein